MTPRLRRILAAAALAAATLVIAAGNDVSDTPLTGAIASWALTVAISVVAIAAAVKRGRRWPALAGVAGLYGVACIALAVFQLSTPLGLDADFVLASIAISAKTLVRMIGWPATILAALAVFGAIAVASASLATIASGLAKSHRALRVALWSLPVLVAAAGLIGLPHRYLQTPPRLGRGENIRPAIARIPPVTRTNGESVFIVQLESVNGLLGENGHMLNGKPVPVDPMSAMHLLARKGIFFPRFWGSAVTTHRAQESILCGAVRNVHPPYFDRLVPWDGQCLPALLRDAGYETVFLSSFLDGTFADTGGFMRRAGFTDIRFADFMKPGDRLTRWGYDEEAFFTRAFEYLRQRYKPGQKLFVYMAVCAHHYGFTRYSKTDATYLLGDEMRRIDQYLWSQRIQDQSLLTFDRLLQDFTGGNAHAFYVPDHSIPLGLYGGSSPSMGATVDNFVTPFVYVPPAARAPALAVGRTIEEMYGQTDLIPTIAELVSGTSMPNSLVPFMLREPARHVDYEQCHVMTQPYGGRWLLVARGDAAYQYRVSTQTLREFRLVRKPLRQQLVREVRGMAYEEFERRYGCRRYRPGASVTRNERTP